MTKHRWIIRLVMVVYLAVVAYFYLQRLPIRFLLLDSALGYVPIELYFWINWVKHKKSKLVLFLFYVLFLPNNAYLLTDLIHLSRIEFYPTSHVIMTDAIEVWLMYFLVVGGIFSLVALGFRSIRGIWKRLSLRYDLTRTQQKSYLVIMFILTSIGVFLGRFIRLNSVTLFSHPLKVLKTFQELVSLRAFFFIAMFTSLQVLLYYWTAYQRKNSEVD
ncbi:MULTISPECIES: DUF1361 domain-containing protein [Enterococcus]|uniref:Uncharacterized protein n=1 Tax=Enterococcus sulfureus ATCC 49903 TaxID=1140003 RepID=S0NPL7_9ENTE|nr:DUF1361 domain-containing protein [Enterococcus sulfureus]EOT45506.1 hypothetical protein OMY_02085 [Enterococcus sulfureus ATCC 49903]EOT83397.1 hypothetical protein I573_01947 [Enterococcus sulfureus ATCC 49903]